MTEPLPNPPAAVPALVAHLARAYAVDRALYIGSRPDPSAMTMSPTLSAYSSPWRWMDDPASPLERLVWPGAAAPLASPWNDEMIVAAALAGPSSGVDAGRLLADLAARHPVVLVWAPLGPDPAAGGPGDLTGRLAAAGVTPTFVGTTTGTDGTRPGAVLAIIDRSGLPGPAPASFRALAVVAMYNEVDVARSCVQALLDDGLAVHVIDNWSTDGTYERVEQMTGSGRVTAERWPPDAPSDSYDRPALLDRIWEVANSRQADWCIYLDADERRRSPWPGGRLVDALHHVDRSGFTAVDHSVVEFHPIDNGFDPTGDADVEAELRWFEFPRRPGMFRQVKAWSGRKVRHRSGGHDVVFRGQRVYPYKFLLKHYPIRSQEHGEQKVFAERKSRWSPEGLARGWHTHYDHVRPGHVFVRDPTTLTPFDDKQFYAAYLVERLTGIGIPRLPPRRL